MKDGEDWEETEEDKAAFAWLRTPEARAWFRSPEYHRAALERRAPRMVTFVKAGMPDIMLITEVQLLMACFAPYWMARLWGFIAKRTNYTR